MLRTVTIAALTAVLAAPAYAGSGCNYGHSKVQASVPADAEYAPTAASATTVEEAAPLQSTPIDDSALVFDADAVLDAPVVIPEG